MKLIKKELIVSVIIIIAFVFIGMNVSVMASSSLDVNGWNFNTSINDNGLIEVEQGNKDQEVVNTANKTNANVANKTNNNKPGQLADTGLADAPWLIIAICAVSTVFAYNKIKEYKDS